MHNRKWISRKMVTNYFLFPFLAYWNLILIKKKKKKDAGGRRRKCIVQCEWNKVAVQLDHCQCKAFCLWEAEGTFEVVAAMTVIYESPCQLILKHEVQDHQNMSQPCHKSFFASLLFFYRSFVTVNTPYQFGWTF